MNSEKIVRTAEQTPESSSRAPKFIVIEDKRPAKGDGIGRQGCNGSPPRSRVNIGRQE